MSEHYNYSLGCEGGVSTSLRCEGVSTSLVCEGVRPGVCECEGVRPGM